MAFTEVENVIAVVIGGLVMAKWALGVLKTLLHKLLSGLGLQGFPGHSKEVVCLPGD
jgi:hypothetical protein